MDERLRVFFIVLVSCFAIHVYISDVCGIKDYGAAEMLFYLQSSRADHLQILMPSASKNDSEDDNRKSMLPVISLKESFLKSEPLSFYHKQVL